jgi:hypothetical protein
VPLELPQRAGSRPRTTPTNPHTQLDQQPADPRLAEELARRALVLAPGEPAGPAEAFLIGREFAHLHPAPDHSAHAMLPPEVVREAVDAGWAEPHPVARMGLIPETAVMLYAPRDDDELAVVETLIRASRQFAGG